MAGKIQEAVWDAARGYFRTASGQYRYIEVFSQLQLRHIIAKNAELGTSGIFSFFQ